MAAPGPLPGYGSCSGDSLEDLCPPSPLDGRFLRRLRVNLVDHGPPGQQLREECLSSLDLVLGPRFPTLLAESPPTVSDAKTRP